ncbi:MAG: hypothetical protein ACOX68_05600 [Candidatus Limivicinus sp.]
MKNKLVAVLFVIVFILLVAVIINLVTDGHDTKDISDVRIETEDTDSHVVTAIGTPQATAAPESAEPTLLPLPTETPMPTVPPTPSPTPIPTEEPKPVTVDLGAGSFRSEMGDKINIIADWTATALNDSQVKVDVTVSVESYSLHLVPARSVNVSLGGEFVSLDAPAVTYDGKEQAVNELASHSFTIDLPVGSSNSYTLAVEWQFGGVYFNVEIPSIECGGSIELVR